VESQCRHYATIFCTVCDIQAFDAAAALSTNAPHLLFSAHLSPRRGSCRYQFCGIYLHQLPSPALSSWHLSGTPHQYPHRPIPHTFTTTPTTAWWPFILTQYSPLPLMPPLALSTNTACPYDLHVSCAGLHPHTQKQAERTHHMDSLTPLDSSCCFVLPPPDLVPLWMDTHSSVSPGRYLPPPLYAPRCLCALTDGLCTPGGGYATRMPPPPGINPQTKPLNTSPHLFICHGDTRPLNLSWRSSAPHEPRLPSSVTIYFALYFAACHGSFACHFTDMVLYLTYLPPRATLREHRHRIVPTQTATDFYLAGS